MGYWNRWDCPKNKPMREGQNCTVTAAFGGRDKYHLDVEGKLGFTQWFIKRADGRLWVRDTAWMKELVLFHHYNLHRLVDEHGKVDEDTYALFMAKLGGQDLLFTRPEMKL